MNIISYAECHLIGLKEEDLHRFLKAIQTFLEEEHIPQNYSLVVHEDELACCGVRGLREVAIEIQGPEKQPVEGLEAKIRSKIRKICKSEGIEQCRWSSQELPRALTLPA